MINIPLQQKPVSNIRMLLDRLSVSSRIVKLSKGTLVSLNDGSVQHCFMLHSGTAVVRRSDNNLIVGNIVAPVLFGFNLYLGIGDQIHIEAITEIEFEVVPYEQFYDTIRRQQLWEPLLDVMMYLSSILFRKNTLLTIRGSAAMICHQLGELMAESDTVRLHTSVHDYIQQRTHLSRSGIMKHLSILRRKGIIDIKNGVLHAIYTDLTLSD
ncbi:helix-turn-helix domain-containing protein [Enterobacter huaxiensis]|jgi:hypothetical protein